MSCNIETDEFIKIEEAISKTRIKSYEYNNFSNIQEIGTGNFGKVFRANWKKTDQYLALKSFFNLDKATIKELVNELELQHEVAFHSNVINFYGITAPDEEGNVKEYLLVMEYADGGSLQNYLKKNCNKLTWRSKYKLAYQLACAVSCLHDEGIVHRDLHSGNVLIHQDNIKLADFGLSRRINMLSKKQSELFGVAPYIDPKKFDASYGNTYSLNEKSDVYSIGILFWEISSCKLPFHNDKYDVVLIMLIFQGHREKTIPDTPTEYADLYTECWDGEPDNRPSMAEVVQRLKKIISQLDMEKANLAPNCPNENLIINSSSHERLSQTIKDLVKISAKESTSVNIKDLLFKKQLIDDIVDLIFKEINEEKNQDLRNQHILDNLSNNNITLLEIYNWLSNNQNEPNFIFLLGYFYYYGIGADENKKEAFNLFNNASKKDHILSQYYVGLCYEFGDGTAKNEELAFEYFKKITDNNKDHAFGQLKIGYFYYRGISIKKDLKEAFNWYEKAANNGNLIAMCNLGLMYKNGEGTNKDINEAIFWYNKSFEGGNKNAQKTLDKLKKIKNRKKTYSCKIN